ncbi:hypothetical protein [Luteolibacter sp. Populi]|uniref:hypothetical protein n=1 Tax=Luteolibacter sp. Populi TaxID=3230487 RepID=UPI003465968D
MNNALHRLNGFAFKKLLVMILLIAAVAVAVPMVVKQKKASDRTKALSNLKQIGAMLFEFDNKYGNFPDDETAVDVKKATGTDLVLSGTFSNDYFRQLLVSSAGVREEYFWCRTAQSPTKPDEDFSTPEKALAAGEVGYSYIMASQTQGQSSSGEPSRPVIVTPSYNFEPDWTFDPEPYQGMAIVLRLDNSATPMQIREHDKKLPAGPPIKTLGESADSAPWTTGMSQVLRAPQPRAGR